MLALLRTLSLRHIRRHRARVALMVMSVALGVAAWTSTRSLDRTLEAALATSATPAAGGADLHVSNGELGLRRSLGEPLTRIPGVARVRPLLVERVLVKLPSGGRRLVVLLGVDLAAERGGDPGRELDVQGGSAAALARAALRQQTPVLVGSALAEELGNAASIEAVVGGQARSLANVGKLEARGAAASLGGHVLVTDLAIAGRLLGAEDRVSRFDLVLDPGVDRASTQQAVAAVLGGSGEVIPAEEHDERIRDALEGLRIGFSLNGMMALGLAFLVTTGAFGVGAAERQAEIGLLRAVGADRLQVGRLFLAEAVSLGLLGALLGIPLGLGLASVALGPLLQVMSDVFMPLNPRSLALDGPVIGLGILEGVATTVIAAMIPTLRAAHLNPLAALARLPESGREQVGRWQRGALLGSVVMTLGCLLLGERIGPRFRTFGSLAAGLAAGLLAIPVFTNLSARLLRPLSEAWLGLPGRLAADHLIRTPTRRRRRDRRGSREGWRHLSDRGRDSRKRGSGARLGRYLHCGRSLRHLGRSAERGGQTLPLRPEIGKKSKSRYKARAVPMTFRYLPWNRQGVAARLMLLALDARAYVDAFHDRRPPLADLDLYRQLSERGTVIVSENFAALYGVSVGDTIQLPGVSGPVLLRVVGTVVDFSCDRGTVMVDRAQFRDEFEVENVDVFSVTLPGSVDVAAVADRLQRSDWGAEHAIVALPRAALRGHILGMIGRLYGVAYVQELAAVVVAGLGVAMALLISTLQRQRELGLLRAVGATPGQAVGLILAEAALLAVVGIALGLVIGVVLEWYVLRVVLLEETGFVFPVLIPWVHAGVVAVVAALGALLAGLGPALRAARLRIAENIAYE
ncbi:MAG: ABC transporter permease [Isosphaeraceae bacterium]